MRAIEGSVTDAVPAWAADLFGRVDAGDVDGVISRLTDDVEFRVGNAPPLVGADQVRDGLTHLFAAIAEMKHNFVEVWEAGEDALLVIDVDYVRLAGDVVTLPSATRIHRRGELVDRVQIFNDVAPALPAAA